MNFEKLKEQIWNSDFNKTNYEIHQDFSHLKTDLLYWSLNTNDKAGLRSHKIVDNLSFSDVIEKIVPKFQRDNTKWSKEMQIKFVENLVLGATSIIMLGSLTGQKSECILLDGLQRITAIFAFQNKEFKIFNEYEYNEEFKDRISAFVYNLKIRIYNFKTEEEMVKFYINMNENITHSTEDILRAKSYLNTLNIKELK